MKGGIIVLGIGIMGFALLFVSGGAGCVLLVLGGIIVLYGVTRK